MNEVCDANGKWLGAHDKSCQREKCKNPKGKLINCFSCQRAFCKPCWKKVSSMLAGMKSAKGFQNCSIEHRPQTQPQTLADCEPLHQQRPRSPIVQSGKPTASLPETPTHSIEQISVPDLDDNNDEPRAIRCAYAAPDPRDVAGNVPPTCKPRKPESLTPSSKRPLEDFISEIENPNSKRGKLTSSISTLSVSQVESSDHVSIPDSQSSLPVSFQDRHGGENIEGQYRSDPNRHKLRDRIMHQLLLDQIQNKKRLLTARQALEHMDGGPGEALDQDGKLIKDRESVVTGDTITSTLSTAQDGREQNSNTVTKVGEAVTIAQGKPKSSQYSGIIAPLTFRIGINILQFLLPRARHRRPRKTPDLFHTRHQTFAPPRPMRVKCQVKHTNTVQCSIVKLRLLRSPTMCRPSHKPIMHVGLKSWY